jgi:hypothetical protein
VQWVEQVVAALSDNGLLTALHWLSITVWVAGARDADNMMKREQAVSV